MSASKIRELRLKDIEWHVQGHAPQEVADFGSNPDLFILNIMIFQL